MLYFDQVTNIERFPDFFLKIICRKNFTKSFIILPKLWTFLFYLFYLFFFRDWFCCGVVKQRNFLHFVDLAFDARFVKYQFSLHYHKQCPINNIKVKYLQIGQKLSDIFWTCSLQIVSDKLRGLLIWSFWSCDSHFW